MPLTAKGQKILAKMRETYKGKGGDRKAEEVFYASIQAGEITGAEKGSTVLTGKRTKARA